jgi:hypothetical protein
MWSRAWRRHADSGPGEQGSLIVVLGVVFVLILLSTALVTRVWGDFNNVNLETRQQQARSLAQSGISDALFQIDQQGASPSSFCNEPNSGGTCTLSSVPQAPGVVYTAEWDAANSQYTVKSQGTVRGDTFAVQAIVKRVPIFTNAVYGGAFITFDGRSTTSVTVTDAYGNAVPGATVGIAVGPGGTMTCNGPVDPNAVYVNYGGSISKCTPVQNLGPIYDPQEPSQTCPPPINPYGSPPTPCMPASVQNCPNMSAGNVTGNDNAGYTLAGPATIEPGVYVCRGGLTVTGTVNVDYAQSPLQNKGRAEIFVFPPNGKTTSPNINLQGSTINQCETIGTGTTGPCKGGLVGDPTDLAFYGWGSGTATLGASNVNAIFWGPGMSLLLNGSADSLTWTGSIILGGITANGHPSFNLNFDQRILTEMQQNNWQITKFQQIKSGFAIP